LRIKIYRKSFRPKKEFCNIDPWIAFSDSGVLAHRTSFEVSGWGLNMNPESFPEASLRTLAVASWQWSVIMAEFLDTPVSASSLDMVGPLRTHGFFRKKIQT
jgi:hypothetical protein